MGMGAGMGRGMGMGAGMGMGMDMGMGPGMGPSATSSDGKNGMFSGMGGKVGFSRSWGGGQGKSSASTGAGSQKLGQPDQVEEMLRNAQGSARMWEIIEQHGHSFNKQHVVTALYQLGLCRQYERRNPQANLTTALVDCLVLYDPREFLPDESSRVLW